MASDKSRLTVPKFIGQTIEQATAYAAQGGVQIQAQGVLGKGHKVRAQDPVPGGKVKRNSVITIFF